MGRTNFDWRWLVVVFIVLIFFGLINVTSSSPLFSIFINALCAWWMFLAGYGPWRTGRRAFGGRETYWRGQRITMPAAPRPRVIVPPTIPLIGSICYFALCALLVLATVLHVVALVRP